MPVEVKNIHFTTQEVKKALSIFSKRRKKYFDHNDIVRFEINEKSKKPITCEIDKNLGIEDNIISYNQAEIGAALIAFCLDYRIPIPKIASKELQIVNKQLILIIRLNHGIEEDVFEIG
ncbi:MAG: hypothetical protein R3D86_12770 [Emcibacteraceae bacterium]